MTWRFLALAVLAGGGCGEVERAPVDAVAGSEQLAPVTYTARVAKTPDVQFGGGAPPPVCTYTMSLQQLVVDLSIRPTGEVVGGRVQNVNVENVVAACMYPPNKPVVALYDYESHTPTAAGASIIFKGDAANETGVALTAVVSRNGNGYNAVLTFHRTDLGPPLDWTVVVMTPLIEKK